MRSFPALVLCLVGGVAGAQDAVIQGKAVKEWQAALKHADARVRFQALTEIYEIGADAAPLLEAVVRLLKDGQPVVRRAAAQAMNGLGEAALPQINALVQALRDKDVGVRQLAVKALVELGSKAVPALEPAFKEADVNGRLAALAVLDGLELEDAKAAVALLSKQIRDSSLQVRLAAVSVLAKHLSTSKEALEALGQAVRDKEFNLRIGAARTLLEQGQEVQALFVAAAEDPLPAVRLTALHALATFKDEVDKDVIGAYVANLEDADAKIRQIAAGGLGFAGSKSREFGGGRDLVNTLVKQMQVDKDTGARQAALFALGQVGLDDSDDLKLLAEGFKDKEAVVRATAVQALSQYSYDEAPAEWRQAVVNHVLQGVLDKDRRVQGMAAQVLVSEGPRAVPGLVRILEGKALAPRLLALNILAEIGAEATEAVPALERLARDGPAELRPATQAAIKKIMP